MNRTRAPFQAMSAENRDRLMALSREVSFPAGARIFEEGGRADHFWIIRTGAVQLDLHVPGRRAPVVETLGAGDLLGWSWLFAPYRWHFGAEALSLVRTREFDAERVRALCTEDPVLGQQLALACAEVVAHRLTVSRSRLLDLYGPHSAVRM
ncbi:cyclic nucleotide-binding domain-containing protein [Streptomyces sp. SID13666]|uniref:cyclic nucleotide-binding domain-containing protein n=1 Tax=unclassified Streptomyces TaxID=2593676 RepID=UPI0013C092E0|nr:MULTISPECIES: cyclic nucleotide-binding domain-containing protein [unclassified Streptomyces]NEA60774.1 cyclic nucleotide-binding domain-containing protein [Streptomyces sp. SID13666]NEA72375.1 cyclic nucleotide-binding domain-containing protein [Streptomyces sp. SID13588]